MLEQGRHQGVAATTERPLVFTGHNRVESAAWISHRRHQRCSLRPTRRTPCRRQLSRHARPSFPPAPDRCASGVDGERPESAERAPEPPGSAPSPPGPPPAPTRQRGTCPAAHRKSSPGPHAHDLPPADPGGACSSGGRRSCPLCVRPGAVPARLRASGAGPGAAASGRALPLNRRITILHATSIGSCNHYSWEHPQGQTRSCRSWPPETAEVLQAATRVLAASRCGP